MAIQERDLIASYDSPECMTTQVNNEVRSKDPRESEGFSFVPVSALYHPLSGSIEGNNEKSLRGGSVAIRAFHTSRASHPVGVYKPTSFDLDKKLPVVVMTTPLGTGVKGHNQDVAEQMMRSGFGVIVKGPPRYHLGRLRALSLTDDVNEMLELTREINKTGMLGNINEVVIYGESQAAMKGLGAIGLAESYGFKVVDGILAAPCYIHAADMSHPVKEVNRMVSMASSCIEFARHAGGSELGKLQGTFSMKDIHHHLAVLPVLASGETGQFLPKIKINQKFTARLFGKDGHSSPRRSQAELRAVSAQADVDIDYHYGHVDGIMSPEFASLRAAKLFEIAQNYHSKKAS